MFKNFFYFIKKPHYLFQILFYLLILSFLLYNSFSYLDPDLGWHLKVGEQIWQEKTVPHYEYYDYTLRGKTWVDHEWLLNLMSYLIYDKFGYIALNVLFAFIVLFVLIILNCFTQKYFARNPSALFYIMLFEAFGAVAMAPQLGVRMQEITLLNLLILLIILYCYNQNKKIKTILWLIPLFYFWACVHAGFLIGLFLLFIWLIVKIIEIILYKYQIYFYFIDFKNVLSFNDLERFAMILTLAIITTLTTPYGLKLYNFLSEYATNTYYLTKIFEWLPLYYFPFFYKQIIYLAINAVIFILLIYLSFTKQKNNTNKQYKINLWEAALFLLFFILAFKSRRHFPLFFITSFPLIIQFWSQFLSVPSLNLNSTHKTSKIIKTYLILIFILSTSLFLVNTNFTNNPFTNPKFCQKYPCEAVNFLREYPKYGQLKIFNEYGWGGFLIWTWPEKKLFIDGRLPQYNFAGHTFLEEYHEFFKKENCEKKLSQYNIQLVLLKKPKPIQADWLERFIFSLNEDELKNPINYLIDYLNSSTEWKLVYDDKVSCVYIK